MDPQNSPVPDPDLEQIQEPPGALPEEWAAADEDWSRYLEEQFEPAPDPSAETEDDQTEDDGGHAPPESPVAPAADEGVGGATAPAAGVTTDPDPNYVQVGDRQLTLDEARRAAELLDWMRANPDKAVDFARYTEGGYQMVPQGYAPQPQPQPQPEPESQETDEDWAFVPPSLREAAKRVNELEQRLNWYDQLTAQQQIAQAQEAVEGGAARFRERHPEIDDATLANLRQTAGQLGIAGALLQQYGDPVRATDEALEWAYARTDQFRDSVAAEQQRVIEDQTKKNKKMAGIGGTSGSAPRNTKPPVTREERDRAMAAEIGAAMSGTQ